MRHAAGILLRIAAACGLLAVSGCATVAPWEMATFGTYGMRGDRDPLDDLFAEHVYFTREGASGGRGVGGGGCGCN